MSDLSDCVQASAAWQEKNRRCRRCDQLFQERIGSGPASRAHRFRRLTPQTPWRAIQDVDGRIPRGVGSGHGAKRPPIRAAAVLWGRCFRNNVAPCDVAAHAVKDNWSLAFKHRPLLSSRLQSQTRPRRPPQRGGLLAPCGDRPIAESAGYRRNAARNTCLRSGGHIRGNTHCTAHRQEGRSPEERPAHQPGQCGLESSGSPQIAGVSTQDDRNVRE